MTEANVPGAPEDHSKVTINYFKNTYNNSTIGNAANQMNDESQQRLSCEKESLDVTQVSESRTSLQISRSRKSAVFIIEGSIDDLTPTELAKLQVFVDSLQQRGNAASLTVRELSEGSIRLVLEGSDNDIERLRELWEERKLDEIIGKHVRQVEFSEASLSDADLSTEAQEITDPVKALLVAKLRSQSFRFLDLQKADLRGADLRRVSLQEANLRGANLSGANLSRANLSRANLTGANLNEANLFRANLNRALLKKTTLFQVNLQETNVKKSRFLDASGLTKNQTKYILSEGAILKRKIGLRTYFRFNWRLTSIIACLVIAPLPYFISLKVPLPELIEPIAPRIYQVFLVLIFLRISYEIKMIFQEKERMSNEARVQCDPTQDNSFSERQKSVKESTNSLDKGSSNKGAGFIIVFISSFFLPQIIHLIISRTAIRHIWDYISNSRVVEIFQRLILNIEIDDIWRILRHAFL